jgi:hypothetical protein
MGRRGARTTAMYDFKRKPPKIIGVPPRIVDTLNNWEYKLLTVED